MRNTVWVKGISAIALVILVTCSPLAIFSQDTLHLNYHHTQIKPHDTTVAKIDKWAKSLNGQKVQIEVFAYYHKSEFKKFAEDRANEMFLVLNRKARELITIKSIGPKKGDHWQRSMVDVVYRNPGAAAKTEEKPKPAAKEKEKQEEPKTVKKEKEEKVEKKAEQEEKKVAKEEKKAKEQKEVKEKQEPIEQKVEKVKDDMYEYDSVYVNGVLKVNKRKIKKKK